MSDFLGDLFREDNLRYFMDLFPVDASSHTLCSRKALAFFFHQEARRVEDAVIGEASHERLPDKYNYSPKSTIEFNQSIHRNRQQDEFGKQPEAEATQRAIADVYHFLARTYEAAQPGAHPAGLASGRHPPATLTPNAANGAGQPPLSTNPPPLTGSLQARRLLYKLLQDTLSEVVATETQARRPRNGILSDALPGSRTAFLRKKWHKLRTNAQVALSAKPKKNPLSIPKQLLKRPRLK
jgi:hypothetical protein